VRKFGAVAQELVDEIAIRRMQLHAVEAGSERVFSGTPVVADDLFDFLQFERPRFDIGLGTS